MPREGLASLQLSVTVPSQLHGLQIDYDWVAPTPAPVPLPSGAPTAHWAPWAQLSSAPVPKMDVALGNGGSVGNVGPWDLILGGGVASYAEVGGDDDMAHT